MSKLKNVWAWLVNSSVDPNKTALTVKGFLTTVGSIVILISPLVHLQIGNDEITAVIDGITQLVILMLTVISSVITLMAFGRKLYLTDWKNSPPTTPQV